MTITEHQQHMADLDKGIKAAEAGIARHLEQRKATKHVISTCDTHTHIYLGLPECPVCVREERDRLRKALEEILRYNQGEDGSGYIDHIVAEALDGK